jgi:hypothetical protein
MLLLKQAYVQSSVVEGNVNVLVSDPHAPSYAEIEVPFKSDAYILVRYVGNLSKNRGIRMFCHT